MSLELAKSDARRLTLPLASVVAIVVAVGGAVSSYAMSKAHIEENEKATAVAAAKIDEQQKQLSAHEVRLGQHDTEFTFIRESLTRIEDKLGTQR